MSDADTSALHQQIHQLEQTLLRTEQNYFEQADQQARAQEQRHAQQLQAMHEQLTEQQQQVQAAQADLSLRNLQLTQAQQELASACQLIELLEPQAQELRLRQLQLAQAQEELGSSLELQAYLSQWRQHVQGSLKAQLKLLAKTLLLRCSDQLRWLLPIRFVRRHRTKLRAVLNRTR